MVFKSITSLTKKAAPDGLEKLPISVNEYLETKQISDISLIESRPELYDWSIIEKVFDLKNIFYEAANKCYSYRHPDGGIIQIGQQLDLNYTNVDTVPLTEKMLVSLVPLSGNRKGIRRLDITNKASVENYVGMVTAESIAVNQEGRVTIIGEVDADTNGEAENAIIYGALTPGTYSLTEPEKGHYKVHVGSIAVSATNGKILIKPYILPMLDDLSDVSNNAYHGQPLVKQGNGTWAGDDELQIEKITPPSGAFTVDGDFVADDVEGATMHTGTLDATGKITGDEVESAEGFKKTSYTDNDILTANGGTIALASLKSGIYQLFNPSDGTTVVVEVNAAGDVLISGNVIISGGINEVEAQQISTSEQTIELRRDATTGMAIGDLSGFVIKLYDGVNDGMIVVDNAGILRIGDVGDLQPVLTREESPVDYSPMYFNLTTKRAETLVGTTTKTSLVDNDAIMVKDSEDSYKPKWWTFSNIKANLKNHFDTLFVRLANVNQTIAGTKTFSSLPKIPLTPIDNEDAASKAYADGQANVTLTAANAARDKAQQWAENPEDVSVETGKYSALHWAANAQQAETAATEQAGIATTKAQEALDSENAAKASEDAAKLSETNAGASAIAANQSKIDSQSAKNLSEAARDKSQQWADEAENTPVETGKYSAKHYAAKSEASKTAAETAKTGAEAARDKAMDWAEKSEDSPVETGKYSAKHYSLKAEEYASQLVPEQVRSQNTNKVPSSKLLDDELTALENAIDANNQTWIGVVIDPTLSSSEPAPKSTVTAYRATELMRTGNLYYHKFGNSRIFNAFQLAIVDRATRKVAWYLNKNNPALRADGTTSTPDWTTQNIAVIVPNLYRRITVLDVGTGKYEIAYDIAPFDGAQLWHEESAHSPGFASVDRTLTQLVSVVSDDVRFRGGNNNGAADGLPSTQLGRPATAISRINFENYAAAAGWETGNIADRTMWHELTALYFANTNIQLDYTTTLTAEGYPQGGLGAGVTGWNSSRWNYRNAYYPIHKVGEGFMTVGCNAGVKSMTDDQYYVGAISSVSAGNLVATGHFAAGAGWSASYIGYTVQNLQTLEEATITGKTDDDTLTLSADIFTTAGQWYWIKGVTYSYQIPVFFGLEHLYGEIWDWVSGVNIEVSATVENGGTGESKAYVCTDFSKRAATITPDYTYIGLTPRVDGYIKELYRDFAIAKVNTGAGSATFMSDYGYYGNIPSSGTSIRGLLFGASAYHGVFAGVRSSYAYHVPTTTAASFGARLRAKIEK